MKILYALLRLLHSERGAATAEYALLLALVVIILIGTLSDLGTALQAKLNDIIRDINGAG